MHEFFSVYLSLQGDKVFDTVVHAMDSEDITWV